MIPGGVSVVEIEAQATARVYPNPARGHFAVESDGVIDELVVYHLLGRELCRASPGSPLARVRLATTGTVLVRVLAAGATATQAVIME